MANYSYVILATFVLLLACVQHSSGEETVQCLDGIDYVSDEGATLDPVLEEYEAALLLLLGFGGFSIGLAIVYNLIRRYVFKDVQNVDSSFDAGGNVSASLTAVTIAGQLLWPGDLMQSVTFATKFGIAGAFWYSAAPLINMSLFPLLSFKFKTRAPGAKTYLQIILTRAGRPTHVLFCFYALLMNAVIMSTILVGGIAVMQATIKDVSPEFCLLVIVTLCGSYSLIGGLGSTFYVSYFNVLITFVSLIVLIFKVIYSPDKPFGSLEDIYHRVNCLPDVPGNRDGSRFTFLSEDSLIMATQSLFLVSSVTYCDQANWQSRVAAKPLQGAIGILFGAFLWFSVPASIGLVTGITYISEAALNETAALSVGQIDSGIVSTYMAQKALGSDGVYMMLIMITMLTMSTGSSEIMGVSSILVYDIYQTYINPYRRLSSRNECAICGKTKRNQDASIDGHAPLDEKATAAAANTGDSDLVCECPSVLSCKDCKKDIRNTHHSSKFPGNVVNYKCSHHGHYRSYQDSLINVKSWCMLWVTVFLIPYGLFLYIVEVDLNWIMFTGAILLVPSFPGVIMSIIWVKVTPVGLIIGSVTGFCTGIASNLLFAYLYYDGEGGFILATSMPYAVLAGSGIGGTVSLVLTAFISLCTHKIKTKEDEDEVWQKLRNIDNPLHPWSQQFAQDFPELGGLYRPRNTQLEHLHRHGRLVSIVGFILFVALFIVIVPSVMTSLEVLSFEEFEAWTFFITAWLMLAASVFIIVTPIEETYNILKTLRSKLSRLDEDEENREGSSTRDSFDSTVKKKPHDSREMTATERRGESRHDDSFVSMDNDKEKGNHVYPQLEGSDVGSSNNNSESGSRSVSDRGSDDGRPFSGSDGVNEETGGQYNQAFQGDEDNAPNTSVTRL